MEDITKFDEPFHISMEDIAEADRYLHELHNRGLDQDEEPEEYVAAGCDGCPGCEYCTAEAEIIILKRRLEQLERLVMGE